MAASRFAELKNLVGALRSPPQNIEQILASQTRALRSLVEHCYQRVPYYHALLERSGVKPEDIRRIEDFRRIPVTSRKTLQGIPDSEILARGVNPGSLVIQRTSGSTGQPLNIRRTRWEKRLNKIREWRMYRALGNRVTDRRATLVRPRDQGEPGRIQALRRRLGIFPMEAINLMASAREILDELRRIRPDILISTSAVAAWLAGELTSQDRREIRPRLIVTWGETITPAMRRLVEEAFQARVVDYYVSHEFRSIAIQCETTGGYHVFDQSVFVEVLKDGEPAKCGEEGELVGTALNSYAMPFLRYRIGDVVTRGPAPCPCGAQCTTLAGIQGRVLDRVPLPDGASVHPYEIIGPVVQGSVWVRRYQFVQERPDLLRLRLVAYSEPGRETLEALQRAIEAKVGGEMTVVISLMEEIPPSPTGKFYPYVSLERRQRWEKESGPAADG